MFLILFLALFLFFFMFFLSTGVLPKLADKSGKKTLYQSLSTAKIIFRNVAGKKRFIAFGNVVVVEFAKNKRLILYFNRK